jgi:hypothetical protein
MGTGVSPSPWSPRNSKTGIMEEWNVGRMGNENFSSPNIPVFHP